MAETPNAPRATRTEREVSDSVVVVGQARKRVRILQSSDCRIKTPGASYSGCGAPHAHRSQHDVLMPLLSESVNCKIAA
jgi:hypothetical protein